MQRVVRDSGDLKKHERIHTKDKAVIEKSSLKMLIWKSNYFVRKYKKRLTNRPFLGEFFTFEFLLNLPHSVRCYGFITLQASQSTDRLSKYRSSNCNNLKFLVKG